MSHNLEHELETRLLRFAGDKGDATIVSYLRTGRQSADPLILTLEKIIYALTNEKNQYLKQATENINLRYPTPLKDLQS